MDGFSSTVRIQDLDDFIVPSQVCIKPVVIEKTTKHVQVQLENDGSYVEINKGKKKLLQPAKITLNDCLACSGCVTTAETVLIEQQTYLELLAVFASNKALRLAGRADESRVVVVSVSPQSRASLAAKYGLSLAECDSRLVTVLLSLGVDVVLDTTFSRNLSLLAIREEFVERLRSRTNLPMLASACPGWICYAEKTHGSFILPYISRSRSPQAVMGALVKSYLSEKLGKSSTDLYHVTIMPCFDKKLEASRNDFLVPNTSVREVDCVISTAEFDLMLSTEGVDISQASDASSDRVRCSPFVVDLLSKNGCSSDALSWINTESATPLSHAGGGSGGYAEEVFRYAALRIFSREFDSAALRFSVLRNRDFQELKLEDADGRVLLSVALAYGFRNIQTLVQKMKRKGCQYDFVEVMACPSGCVNGGGQIKGATQSERTEILGRVSELYDSAKSVRPDDVSSVQALLDDWLDGSVSSQKAKEFLYTDYHAVEKTITPFTLKW